MTEHPTETLDTPRVVTLRTLLLALIAAVIVSVGAAVALSYVLIGQPEPGPRGPAGAQGEPGVPGERGRRGPRGNLDEEAVWTVVESDPQRVTNLVEETLDPTPSDVRSEVETVAADLSSLCSDLSFADALSDVFLVCP
jgi:hypothetical protein